MLFIKIEVYRMVGGGGGRVFHRNIWLLIESGSFQVALVVRNPPANAEASRDQVLSLGQEDPLEKEMATYSNILAWRIPWTEEPSGLQSVGSQRVGHN